MLGFLTGPEQETSCVWAWLAVMDFSLSDTRIQELEPGEEDWYPWVEWKLTKKTEDSGQEARHRKLAACSALDILRTFHLNSPFADSEHRVNPLVTAHLLWDPVVLNPEYKGRGFNILSMNSLFLGLFFQEHSGKIWNSNRRDKQTNQQKAPLANKQQNWKHFAQLSKLSFLRVEGHQYHSLGGAVSWPSSCPTPGLSLEKTHQVGIIVTDVHCSSPHPALVLLLIICFDPMWASVSALWSSLHPMPVTLQP